MRSKGNSISTAASLSLSNISSGWRVRRMISIAVAMAFAMTVFNSSQGLASAAPNDADLLSGVDASNMAEIIQALQDLGSRDFHLESANEAAAYIHDLMVSFGLQVEYQRFMVDDIEVSNIVGTLGEGFEEPMYLFGAHYDSENSAIENMSMAENLTAPGADDDASGVAAVMEIARILSEAGADHTVRFVAFGAEEYGYDHSGGSAGSRYFASQEIALGHEYAGTAIFDMIGFRAEDANRAVLVINDSSYPLAEATAASVNRFDIDLSLETMNAPRITYSDHGSFWEVGYPSMLVVEELEPVRYYPINPYYHTSQDTIDKLSMDQVVAVTQAVLGGYLTVEEGGGHFLAFGIGIMLGAGVPLVAYAIFRRRRHDVGDDDGER